MSLTSHEVFKTADDVKEIVFRCRVTTEACWVWLGSTQFNAPYFEYKNQPWNPQVVLFELKYDRIMVTRDDIVAHCRNHQCCNPVHIEIRGSKQQLNFGQKTVKLTPFEIRAIRQEYATGRFTMKELQDKYGIRSCGYISDLIHHKKGTKYIIPEIPTSSAVPGGEEILAHSN